MAGLDKWFKQKWVDIGSKKKDGSFSKCGRSKQKADGGMIREEYGSGGRVARGCGKVMANRRKKTKYY